MKFVRGDSQPFKFRIVDREGNDVDVSHIETLFITCRKQPERTSPIIFQKTLQDIAFSDGYFHAEFLPTDTEDLEYGKYYFDICFSRSLLPSD